MSGKYKVGDYVRIRGDLVAGQMYGGVMMLGGMLTLRGHLARIVSTEINGNYRLSIGGYYWQWSDKMLEPVQFPSDGKKDHQGKKKMPPSAEKLCKLIGALLYAGAEEFTVSYSHGEVSCNAQIDVGEVKDR